MDRRRLLIVLVPVGLLLLAFVPAVVAFGRGWLRLAPVQLAGAPAARDTTSPEAWAVFAVVYLFWTIGLIVVLVWAYDRLDYHWQYHRRKPRPLKKRRRTAAGLSLLEGQEEARAEAARRPEPRAAGRRPRSEPGDDAERDPKGDA